MHKDYPQPQRLELFTHWHKPQQQGKYRQHQIGDHIETDAVDKPGQLIDDHRPQNRRQRHHAKEHRGVSGTAFQHVSNEIHVAAAAQIEHIDQQKGHQQYQQQLIVFQHSTNMFTNAELAEQRQRQTFAYGKEAPEEHHYGNGTQ